MSESLIKPLNEWPIAQMLATPSPAQLIIPKEIFVQRDELLAESANLERVAGEASQTVAGKLLARIGGLLRQVEKDRKLAKAPLLSLGSQLDLGTGTFIEGLTREERRIKGLVGKFQEEIQRKAEAEQAARDAELAELNRIQAEKDMAAATAQMTPQQSETMQQDIDKAAVAVLERPVTVVVKTAGLSAKPVRQFRVTDIHALYKARPDLVTLTEKRAAINGVIRSTDAVAAIAGIEQYEEMAVSQRS